jgi:FkbM family methyltransferase
VVVQAGGNVGLYPARLAQHFNEVITFEPDPDNFACLKQNLGEWQDVKIYNAALGARPGSVATTCHEVGNCGAIGIVEDGNTPRMTIDGLDLKACDLIWLDIETYEVMALHGAEQTIKKFKPAIIIEEKGERDASLLLEEDFGYTHQLTLGNDHLYTCST